MSSNINQFGLSVDYAALWALHDECFALVRDTDEENLLALHWAQVEIVERAKAENKTAYYKGDDAAANRAEIIIAAIRDRHIEIREKRNAAQ